MNTALHFSSKRDDWQTPPELFAELNAEFNFDVDVAAGHRNSCCDFWCVADENGGALTQSWDWGFLDSNGARRSTTCWCNPPYSRGLQGKFIAKAAAERLKGVTTVMLLPARTDTKAFHAYIWDEQKHQPREGVEVRFLKGRLKFVGAKDAAPFPSMIVVFRPPSLVARDAS